MGSGNSIRSGCEYILSMFCGENIVLSFFARMSNLGDLMRWIARTWSLLLNDVHYSSPPPLPAKRSP